MLTWALIASGQEWATALPYVFAMGCDVAIVYYIVEGLVRILA